MDRINFSTSNGQRFATEHFKYLQDSIISQLSNRSILYTSPGIISSIDPKNPSTPLEVIDSDPGNINVPLIIKKGACLLNNGELLIVENDVTLAKISDTGDYFISITGEDSYFNEQITFFETTVNSLINTQPTFSFIPISNYTQNISFSEYVAFYSTSTGVSNTHNTLNIRRWSSPSDAIHRNKSGSGAVTEANPHGLTLMDMDLTDKIKSWEMLSINGVFNAHKDPISKIYKGSLILETVNVGQWVSNAYTLKYMLHNVALITNATYTANYSFTLDKLTRVITLDVAPTEELVIHAVTINIGNFYKPSSNDFQLNMLLPTDEEVIINNGSLVPVNPTQTFNLAAIDNYPYNYKVIVDSTNTIVLNPKVLLTSLKLSDLNNNPYDLLVTLNEVSRITLLVANTTQNVNLGLELYVEGFDAANSPINDTFIFDNAWTPLIDFNKGKVDNNITISFDNLSNLYKQVTKLTLISSVNADIDTTVQVLADIEPSTDITELLAFKLSAVGIEDLVDVRNITLAPLSFSTPELNFFKFDDPIHADYLESSWKPGPYLEQGSFISRQLRFTSPTTITLFSLNIYMNDVSIQWKEQSSSTYVTLGVTSGTIPAQTGVLRITSGFSKILGYYLT